LGGVSKKSLFFSTAEHHSNKLQVGRRGNSCNGGFYFLLRAAATGNEKIFIRNDASEAFPYLRGSRFRRRQRLLFNRSLLCGGAALLQGPSPRFRDSPHQEKDDEE
jgi:hypothetical protein